MLGWPREVRVLERFGFRDGMHILELGSGPGFVTAQLLAHFPASRITAVEVDAGLLDDARAFLGEQAARVQFVNASATDVPLEAGTHDAAYARLLFQHLPDPGAAAAEAFRLLRGGSPFVVYDIDDAIWGLSDPRIPGYDAIVRRLAMAQASQGGNRYVGRRLWPILRSAGFGDLDLEVVAKHSDELGLEPFLPQLDPDRLQLLVRAGIFAPTEMARLQSNRATFLASDHPYLMLLALMVSGRRPPLASTR
jgi:SAM-dependent methyltransferase